MEKLFHMLITWFIMTVIVFGFAGCPVNNENSENTEEDPSQLVLDITSLDLEIGKNVTLQALLSDTVSESAIVTWSSSDTSIVGVNQSGTVTAVSGYYYAGPVTITASVSIGMSSHVTATCKVRVVDPGVNENKGLGQDLYKDYYKDYNLTWYDEFDYDGEPTSDYWSYEEGYQRNNELQYYRKQNANVQDGVCVITGERVYPPLKSQGKNFNYASACMHTLNKKHFRFGILEVRARIPPDMGSWPAIWTLGATDAWPGNGEIDVMEYYRHSGGSGYPKILANYAWRANTTDQWVARWDGFDIPMTTLAARHGETPDEWTGKFHVWRLLRTEDYIEIYMDGVMLNRLDDAKLYNPGAIQPRQPFQLEHYLLLNLAIGGNNGGTPDHTTNWPMLYEIDYVRWYEPK